MSGSNSLNLVYDGTERRVYKKETVNSVNQEQIYLHDGMQPIIERQKSGQTTEYIMGPTGIIAVRTNGAECYIIKDHLGSTRVVVDKTGTVQSGYEYSSFGTLISSTGTNGINYRFTGQEYDGLTGLHNFKARMYESGLNAFYARDPAGQYVNPYSYCGNSPIVMRDEDGEFAFVPILVAMAYGAAIGGGISGAAYTAQALATDNWKLKDFGKAVGFGALTGAIGAGVGSFASQAVYEIAGVGVTSIDGTVKLAGSVSPWLSVGASTGGGIAGGAASGFSGGYLSGARGDKLWKSTWQGGVMGGASGFISSEPVMNWIKGDGFMTDWQRAENIYKERALKHNLPKLGSNYSPATINIEGTTYDWGLEANCSMFCNDYMTSTGGQYEGGFVSFENSHVGVPVLKSRGIDYIVNKPGPSSPVSINTGYQLQYGSLFNTKIQNFNGYGRFKYFDWKYFKLEKYPF